MLHVKAIDENACATQEGCCCAILNIIIAVRFNREAALVARAFAIIALLWWTKAKQSRYVVLYSVFRALRYMYQLVVLMCVNVWLLVSSIFAPFQIIT